MAKVYISCHHPDPANELARELVAHGHTVVSTWHTATGPRPDSNDEAGWRRKADANCQEIEGCDVLVVVASPDHLTRVKCVPGGKFFEAGYAHALKNANGKTRVAVYTRGGVENGMLYTSGVRHAKDTADLLAMLN